MTATDRLRAACQAAFDNLDAHLHGRRAPMNDLALARLLRAALVEQKQEKTMKAKVEICYEDKSKNRTIEVPIKGSPKGVRLMNAVEKSVEKMLKDNADYDQSWTRWNLLDVIEA